MGTRAGTEVNEYTDVSQILDTDPYLTLFWCEIWLHCTGHCLPLQSYFSSGWHSFDPGMEIHLQFANVSTLLLFILFSRLLGSRSIQPHPVHTSISCLACPSFSGQGLLQAPTAPGTDLCHNASAWVEMLLFPSVCLRATEPLERKGSYLILETPE